MISMCLNEIKFYPRSNTLHYLFLKTFQAMPPKKKTKTLKRVAPTPVPDNSIRPAKPFKSKGAPNDMAVQLARSNALHQMTKDSFDSVDKAVKQARQIHTDKRNAIHTQINTRNAQLWAQIADWPDNDVTDPFMQSLNSGANKERARFVAAHQENDEIRDRKLGPLLPRRASTLDAYRASTRRLKHQAKWTRAERAMNKRMES